MDRRRRLALLPYRLVSAVAGDPRLLIRRIRGVAPFALNAMRYARRSRGRASFRIGLSDLYPQLTDRFAPAGQASGHYFHQDLWAARHIWRQDPRHHVDVGSRLDGFVAHLLVFREVWEVDIRPLPSPPAGLRFVGGDMRRMPFRSGSLVSLSSLHAMEHVGLGRYGDPIDPDGWSVSLLEMVRCLAPDGRLYLSVPIGRERLEFDAHRVFDPLRIIEAARPLVLHEFSAVNDAGDLERNVDPAAFRAADYSCGLFLFRKPAS
jgi:SAM-dependent methyltransferase